MRAQFWSEAVYSKAGSVIPRRLRKGNEAMKWSISKIVGELLREPDDCRHVTQPIKQPEHIWGLPPAELRNRERQLYEGAGKVSETYTRRGRTHGRRQKSTTPILLMAVASYPVPNMIRTDERDRWVGLVIEYAKSLWDEAFKGAYAHVDEAFYHLHLWVDDDGKPVKPLHAGHTRALSAADEGKDRKGQARAYKLGCVEAQDMYHVAVGKPMGWARKSLTPRPRLSRPAAMRHRQEQLEQVEERLIVVGKKQLAEKTELEYLRARLAERDAFNAKREALINEQVETLRRMRSAIEDQHAIEDAAKRLMDTGYWRGLGA